MLNPLEVYCLTEEDGERLLRPAVQSTVLAKYSRSPLSAREIVKGLTAEEADKFQEKWVIGYSHSSVAELAVIPICFEGVSMIASKFLESYQRPAYSEKSTRYQVFNRDSFVNPPGRNDTYMNQFVGTFYDAYESLFPRMCEIISKKTGLSPSDRLTKVRAFDNVRYLLPAGTGTNLAWVGNARDARYMMSEALGHTNDEIRKIGEAAVSAVSKVCPVFVKDVAPDSTDQQIISLGPIRSGFDFRNPDWSVSIYQPHLHINSSLIEKSFQSMVSDLFGMSWLTFSKSMETRGKKRVPKIFRKVRIGFDIIMDYGAYRDLQRHRRCEQYAEPLSSVYGYLVPDDIIGTELEADYRAAMEHATTFPSERVSFNSDELQYVIPLGYLHRSHFEMDLQELYYLTELRTQPQGHISYRRVAYKMYEIAKQLYPELMKWCRAIKPDEIGFHT